MARTQRNKATAGHLGLLKARLAKLRRELLTPKGGGGGPFHSDHHVGVPAGSSGSPISTPSPLPPPSDATTNNYQHRRHPRHRPRLLRHQGAASPPNNPWRMRLPNRYTTRQTHASEGLGTNTSKHHKKRHAMPHAGQHHCHHHSHLKRRNDRRVMIPHEDRRPPVQAQRTMREQLS